MTKKEALVQLHRLLVEVFASRDDARRLADQSGINPSQIRDGDTLSNYWWNALVAAHQRNKVVDIVKNASWEVGERAAEFKQAYGAYADAEDSGKDIQPLGVQTAPSGSYIVNLSGSGAVAQGPGAVAAGEGAVAVGGDVGGNIVAGNRNVVGDVDGDVDMSEHHVEQKGKYNVNIGEASGLAIGDGAKVVKGDEVGGDKVGGDKVSTGDVADNIVNVENMTIYPGSDPLTRSRSASTGRAAPLIEESIRLDVAAPSSAILDEPFDLAVAVRQPGSPPLSIEEFLQVVSENGTVFRTEKDEIVTYRIEVTGIGFLVTPSHYVLQLRPLEDSPPRFFQIEPHRPGIRSLVVNAYQEDEALAAQTRIKIEIKLPVQDP